MGRRSVKKPKQKFVTMEMFQEFCQLTSNFIDAADASLDSVDVQIKLLQNQAVKDLGLMSDAIGRLDTRLKSVENIAYNPIVNMHTGQVTQEMLNDLKKSVPNPVWVSTPTPRFKCIKHDIVEHLINGVPCNLHVPQPKSTVHTCNVTSACTTVLEAVKQALRKMNNIEYIAGTTGFNVRVKCQNHWRLINANFYDGYVLISYYRRNGKYCEEKHSKLSTAAANLTAICMYYATR